MWCNSVWDFPLESAINELMGRVWGCCVCAVYGKHRPPLEVTPTAVQRLKEGHAATQKGLRRSPRKRVGKEITAGGGDSVVSCKHCHVSVHLGKLPTLSGSALLPIHFSSLPPLLSTSLLWPRGWG